MGKESSRNIQVSGRRMKEVCGEEAEGVGTLADGSDLHKAQYLGRQWATGPD